MFDRMRDDETIIDHSRVCSGSDGDIDNFPVLFRRFQIADWTGKTCDPETRRLPSTPCYHKRMWYEPVYDGPITIGGRNHTETTFSSTYSPWHHYGPSSDGVSNIESWVEPAVNQCAQQAFDSFVDQVPEDISLGNFAIEAKEAALLIPSLIDSYQHWIRNRPPLHDIAGDGLLQYNFAVAPLIGDLFALANLANSTMARLEEIRAMNGKRTVLSFRRNNLYSIPLIPPTFDVWPGPTLQKFAAIRGTMAKAKAGFTAKGVVEVDIDQRHLDGAIGFMRTFLGSSGLNNPLGIIWNAIPFSFVLDWVFDFSGFLSRRKVKPFPGTWKVVDFSWSLRTNAVWNLHWLGRYPNSGHPYRLVGRIHQTSYRRETSLPVSELAALVKGGLSPKQSLLLLALIR